MSLSVTVNVYGRQRAMVESSQTPHTKLYLVSPLEICTEHMSTDFTLCHQIFRDEIGGTAGKHVLATLNIKSR